MSPLTDASSDASSNESSNASQTKPVLAKITTPPPTIANEPLRSASQSQDQVRVIKLKLSTERPPRLLTADEQLERDANAAALAARRSFFATQLVDAQVKLDKQVSDLESSAASDRLVTAILTDELTVLQKTRVEVLASIDQEVMRVKAKSLETVKKNEEFRVRDETACESTRIVINVLKRKLADLE